MQNAFYLGVEIGGTKQQMPVMQSIVTILFCVHIQLQKK